MNTEEAFKKLRPVLGKKLDPLWIEYQMNPKKRAEIEGFLNLLAMKHFGSPHGPPQIRIAPPPPEVSSGEVPLGIVLYGTEERGQFGLRNDEWIQHIGIPGRIGTGKTNLGFLLVAALAKKRIPILVLDWKRNYRDLLLIPGFENFKVFTVGRDIAPFAFNPLIPPPGAEPEIFLKKLIETMMHIYGVREGVAYLLQEAIDAVYRQAGVYYGNCAEFPTMFDVRDWLKNYKAKGRERQWMASALRAVNTLCYGLIGRVINTRSNASFEAALESNTVLELEALSESDKAMLIGAMLLWLHDKRMREPGRETLKHATILEEAHHVLLRRKESKETIMDIILREIRELGESIIFLDQHPSRISIPALGNCYTTIAMNLKHANDVAALSRAMLLNDEEKDCLGRLPVGEAIVRLQGRWPKPFHIRFNHFPIQKGKVTDEDLKRLNRGDSAPGAVIPPSQPVRKDVPAIPAPDNTAEKRLLVDVMEYPTSGIAERRARLGLSARRIYDLMNSHAEKGLIACGAVPTPTGRVKVAKLTNAGRAALGLNSGTSGDRHESLEHWYWKMRLAEIFRGNGYAVEVEKDGADLAVQKDGKRIAVEIETGKSDWEANIRRDLELGFDNVIVVWTRSLPAKTDEHPKLRHTTQKELLTDLSHVACTQGGG